MPPEDFQRIYEHCDAARMPRGLPYSPGVWWRALLTTAYLTGWRIGETLQLRREDVDTETGLAKLRAKSTKGRRDAKLILHPIVLEHLAMAPSFHDVFFPWSHHNRTLHSEFHRIQKAAGIHLTCPKADEHDCTPACHLYGFHDERRAFATMNAGNFTADVLQVLMRHRSYSTTQRYINMAKQMEGITENVYVPDHLVARAGGK